MCFEPAYNGGKKLIQIQYIIINQPVDNETVLLDPHIHFWTQTYSSASN